MAGSIVEAVAEYAGKFPDRLCMADMEGGYTYAQIWEQVKAAAGKLETLGIRKNDCVMVECTQDARYLVCDLACELCGAIFVPVEHRASIERVRTILDDTDAKLLVCSTAYDVPVERITVESLACEDDGGSDGAGKAFVFPESGDTAEILYTTGTTGTSKGIEVTHANNIALAENIKYGTEMKPDNIELIPLPLSHSHGIRCCYANLLNGSAVVLIEGVSWVKNVFGLIEKYHVTSMDVSPSAALFLDKLAKGKLAGISPQIDYIQVGTEVLKEHVKEMLISRFPSARLYNFYGSTESGRTCVLDFNKEKGRAGCIGKPTKNTVFIVTDENRRPIESSEENMGLFATAGPMNMKGYWRQPGLTEEIMQNGYIYTKDLGYMDADGFVYMKGRKDNIINCQGIKIAPEEIEEVVIRYEEVEDCACVPKEDRFSGQVPKLFVVVRSRETFQEKDLMNFLLHSLDGNKLPKEIEVIDEIPRTYNGKIHRVKLIEGNGIK